MEKSERYIVAVLLKHYGLIPLAMYSIAGTKSNQVDTTEANDELIPLWRTAYKIRKQIIQDHQMSNTR